MSTSALAIGSQVVGMLYAAKRRQRLSMNRFAVLVGIVDAIVVMAEHADRAGGSLQDRAAHEFFAEIVQDLEEDLPEVMAGVVSAMLISRADWDELLNAGEIAPLELLVLLRAQLQKALSDTER